MIAAVLNLPETKTSLLIVVIEKENLGRMAKADPITLESEMKGGLVMPRIDHPENLSLLIAYEQDDVELYRLAQAGDTLALLRWLERGRTFNPQVDGPENVISLKPKGDPHV